jgi:serine protease Do
MEQYENYGQPVQPANIQKPRRGRGVAMALVGALLGSVIGGGGVALYFDSTQDDALNAKQQAYIDQAVADAADDLSANVDTAYNTDGSGTIDDTVYNEVNLVTTDYSTTVKKVAETVSDSVVGVSTSEGSGTGVIVSSDGLILTNEHVIAVSDTTEMFRPGFDNSTQQTDDTVTVKLADGTEYEAKVLYSDEDMDLAVIKIDAEGLTAATLGDSDSVSVGEIAIAIGNPLGLDQTVTSGIISALDVSEVIESTQTATGISAHITENLIQTDAAINSGNSGGALLNAAGEVIGINSYKLSSGEGIGFAIPINAAKPIIKQIIETGEFKQAVMGVTLIDSEMLKYYDYDITLDSGLYVYQVDASSDAYAQGLKSGDIITAIGGVEVNTVLEAKEQIYQHLPGDSVTLTVERSGGTVEINVVLEAAE